MADQSADEIDLTQAFREARSRNLNLITTVPVTRDTMWLEESTGTTIHREVFERDE